jgi:8-oxo-dGTP diphosphatase
VRWSGDGFVILPDGSRRWGIYGAAGVLVRHVDASEDGTDGETRYFVALRSELTHQGGTWAVPGGAIDWGESPVEAALREFGEEVGDLIDTFEVVETHVDDHGGWSYTTVVIEVPERFRLPANLHWETAGVRWATADELDALPLFDAFRATLVRLGILAPPS